MSDEINRAVVARPKDGAGIVLWYTGWAFEELLKDTYMNCLEDLGLEDAPKGISVWEGTAEHKYSSVSPDDDGEIVFTGAFREPAKFEWEVIKTGNSPWDKVYAT